MRQRVTAAVGVLALIGLVFAINFYRLPVIALSPGPMEDVLARLKVEGSRVYDSEGKLYLTSVGIDDDVRFYEALLDMANRDVQLLPRAELYPEEQDTAEIDKENADLMDRSKETASVVALREVGYEIEPSGVEVTQVVAGTPADGKLRAGDRILDADGRAVASTEEVRAAITRHEIGERVAFRIDRDDTEKNVSVQVRDADGQPRVGILLRDLFPDLPVKVSIETENNIGGPSAGLMFTLSIIDKLTPEDLTGGRRIAGTGEIALDGGVLPVGGVAEKLIAVRRLGVTTFLIPAENCDSVRGRVPDGLRLVKVATITDALRFLRDPKAA
ncbi:MAG TPA: PDZ domain-containing protein, partial [Actinomycetes bacterium]|nr:PDZ domain-containing protein [Actinomycetes bacterium]